MGKKKKSGWNFDETEKIGFNIDIESNQIMNFFSSVCYKIFGDNRFEYPKKDGSSLLWKTRLKPHAEVRVTPKNDGTEIELRANYYNATEFGVFACVFYPLLYLLFIGNMLSFLQSLIGYSEQVATMLNIVVGWGGLFASIFLMVRILQRKRRRSIPKHYRK